MRRRAFLQASAASALAAPAIAQDWRATTMRFAPQANLTALDPVWTTATVTNGHGYYVFDTLFAANSKLEPKPQMASGHEVERDGRLWRIKLRENLFFHDGEPVRAVDCITSLQRWAKKDAFGQILADRVEKWVAVDDRTLEIHLTKPFPLLLDALAKPDSYVAFIMPERLAKTDPTKQVAEMVGSGPYKFLPAEYNSGSRVAYEKFEKYVPRDEAPDWASGAKRAYFKRVEWHVLPDPATAAAALQNGEVDWWERPLSDLLPALRKHPQVQVQVADPAGRLALLRMNTLHPPFNDVKLRQVIRLSVNQEDYMRAARGDDPSLWTISRSLFPKNTPYFHDYPDLMPGDMKAAAAALKAAGYAGQKAVIINPTDFPDIGPLGQVTAENMRKLGMDVDLAESDWGTVVQRRTKREPIDKGGWSMLHTTASASSLSSPAVNTYVRGQGLGGWFGWWESEKAEALAREWVDAPDAASQARLAQALNRLALEEVATLPVGQFFLQTAFRKRLTGVLQGVAPYPWNVRPA